MVAFADSPALPGGAAKTRMVLTPPSRAGLLKREWF